MEEVERGMNADHRVFISFFALGSRLYMLRMAIIPMKRY